MAGYLGTKAVFLSTTASSVTGNASVGGDFTVDTNTLHVDSTNNFVGFGTTTAPSASTIKGVFAGNGAYTQWTRTSTTIAGSYAGTDGNGLVFGTHTGNVGAEAYTERMRITSGGDVGIATSSPASIGTGIPTLEIKGNNASQSDRSGAVSLQRQDGAGGMYIGSIDGSHRVVGSGSYPMSFYTNSSERMRIDASGNVLVGTTTTGITTSSTTEGVVLTNDYIGVARLSNPTAYFNRMSTDGDVVVFRKNGTKFGEIGVVYSDDIYIGSNLGNTGIGIGTRVFPTYREGLTKDNLVDLGDPSARWDDIYATNGTIQTSDRNEKQQIASLTDAEMQAAKAISALFKTFKWNDKVAEKGDAARKHTGVIAQDVQQAMSDAGLDAGDYAFFISSTWWETQTEVPAVEAVAAQDAVYEDVIIPAVLDEEGNEIEPERTEQRLVSEAVDAVEAQEAYTRTDTYDTLEEAPAGATERTRLGIRYPELLAFIGAATEQRLASIEARLDALEGV